VKQKLRSSFITRLNLTETDILPLLRSSLNLDELIQDIMNFTAAFPALGKVLFNSAGRIDGIGHGIGCGEMLIYFIYDDVTLGGTTSSIDIHQAGKPVLEIKCARKRGDTWQDFRLGSDEWMAGNKFLTGLIKLLTDLDNRSLLLLPENLGNIPRSIIEQVCLLEPIGYHNLEETYFTELLRGPMGGKQFLFFDTETRLPIYQGYITRKQLSFERFSGGLAKLQFRPEL
jgi:hypothetical protein